MEHDGNRLQQGVRVGIGGGLPNHDEFSGGVRFWHTEVSIRDGRAAAKTGKFGTLACQGKGASFPVFTFCSDSATICLMFKLNVVFEFMAELMRTLLVGESAERVRTKARSLRVPRRLRGMKQVRRHVHRQCRRRLLDKLST